MNAAEKIAQLIAMIEAGRTVYVCTHTRITAIKKRNLQSFAKIGRELLKAKGNSMYMSVGNRYDCIDYCTIRIG